MSLPETQKVVHGDQNGDPIFKEVPLPKPSENQVIVKVEFAPINPTDLLRLNGFYGRRDIIGSEGSGIVVAVGSNLKISHKVGDRVHILGPGTYAQYVVIASENLYPIQQDDLSFEDAASHYINPATVHYMGYFAEKGGHKAAIHSAGSSALGRMLIKYFKLKGIKLINIVRRDDYIDELKKEGADYVLNSQSPDFETKLKELAEKEKATIAFDAIAGDFTNKILKSQPANSTTYVYGVLSDLQVKPIDASELFKNKSVAGLYLFNYLEDSDEQKVRNIFQEVHSLLPTVFKTNVIKVFPLDQIKEAFEYYQANSSKGKILLKLN